ncbi:MAG: hypothetical protein IKW26_04865 [Treponema sp.]|nr:hypothetical protein [Treponema sp.]
MKKLIFVIISCLTISFSFAQDLRLMVSDIQAQSLSSREILVSWQLPAVSAELDVSHLSLFLYRSQQQKAGSSSLAGMEPLAILPFNTTSYTDTPGTEELFYYTVIIAPLAEADIPEEAPQHLVIPDKNTTVIGVQLLPHPLLTQELAQEVVQEKPNAATGMRNTPLPYLKMSLQSTDIPINPERNPGYIHGATDKGTVKPPNLPAPYIFRQEQEAENVGEDFILQEIIQNQFKNEQYELAEQALRDFLSINHSKDATDRGTFYLGETLLYQGKYQQSLSCFLRVQDRFPDLTARWIQAALDGYQLPVME